MRVRISTSLTFSPGKAWEALQRPETFLYVNRGLLGFSDTRQLPQRWQEGFVWQSRLLFFHWIPGWTHRLRIARVDGGKRELLIEGGGHLVSAWNHSAHIEPISENRCRYIDETEFKAGWLTPLVWCFSQLFYRYRQAKWRKLARS